MPTLPSGTAHPTLPRRVELYYRPPSGGRWMRVLVAPDHATATARIDGPGDWWFHELPDEPAGPTLFDDVEPESPAGGSR